MFFVFYVSLAESTYFQISFVVRVVLAGCRSLTTQLLNHCQGHEKIFYVATTKLTPVFLYLLLLVRIIPEDEGWSF